MGTRFGCRLALGVLLIYTTATEATAMVSGSLRLSTAALPSEIPYRECFERSADRHRVPASLLAAVARVESAYDPMAVSHKDAVGIMQIRWPLTARHLGIERREVLFNPCLNIDAGARYLNELLARFETPEQALAAYNMGPSRIAQDRTVQLPAAGRQYVSLVTRAHERLGQSVGLSSVVTRSSAGTLEFPVQTKERALAVEAALRARNPDVRVTVQQTRTGWVLSVAR